MGYRVGCNTRKPLESILRRDRGILGVCDG